MRHVRSHSYARGLLGRATRLAAVAVSMVFFVAACGLSKSNQDGVCRETGASEAAVAGFASKVHPLFATFQCASCHTAGGSGAGAFADPSSSTAFNAAKRLVSLGSPESSLIVGKLRSGHQCGALAQCNDWANQLADGIRGWSADAGGQAGLGGCQGRGIQVVLAPKAIKIADLDLANDTLLTWNIHENQALIPNDVWFRIAVKLLTAPQTATDKGSFLFNKPQLLSHTKKFRITNVSFMRDGIVVPDLVNFLGTSSVSAPDPTVNGNSAAIWPIGVASSANQIVLAKDATESLGVQLFLEETEDAPGQEFASGVPACVAFSAFDVDVYPILSGRCFGCHANAGSNAHRAFPQTGSRLDVCMEAKLRSDLVNIENSKIIRRPQGLDGHNNIGVSGAEFTRLRAWINAEAAGE